MNAMLDTMGQVELRYDNQFMYTEVLDKFQKIDTLAPAKNNETFRGSKMSFSSQTVAKQT